MIDNLNQFLFLCINATPHSVEWILKIAIFFARDLIAIVPILIIILWIYDPYLGTKKMLLKTSVALLYALIISWMINYLFPYPRPFVVGFGHQYLSHAPDNSCPSKHGTIIFTFALSFIFWQRIWLGLLLLVIGISISWSRIYLGVHWPIDMIGSFLTGVLGCLFAKITFSRCASSFMKSLYQKYRLFLK